DLDEALVFVDGDHGEYLVVVFSPVPVADDRLEFFVHDFLSLLTKPAIVAAADCTRYGGPCLFCARSNRREISGTWVCGVVFSGARWTRPGTFSGHRSRGRWVRGADAVLRSVEHDRPRCRARRVRRADARHRLASGGAHQDDRG